MSEKAKHAGLGAGLFGAAGLVALYGVGALSPPSSWRWPWCCRRGLAALIVTVVLFAVAAAWPPCSARSKVTEATPPTPERTIDNVKQDVATVKGRGHERRTTSTERRAAEASAAPEEEPGHRRAPVAHRADPSTSWRDRRRADRQARRQGPHHGHGSGLPDTRAAEGSRRHGPGRGRRSAGTSATDENGARRRDLAGSAGVRGLRCVSPPSASEAATVTGSTPREATARSRGRQQARLPGGPHQGRRGSTSPARRCASSPRTSAPTWPRR